MYRGMLELKNDSGILHKNGSLSNKTCGDLTVLFLKMKIYFCRCNFVNKQVNTKIHFGKNSFGNGTSSLWP